MTQVKFQQQWEEHRCQGTGATVPSFLLRSGRGSAWRHFWVRDRVSPSSCGLTMKVAFPMCCFKIHGARSVAGEKWPCYVHCLSRGFHRVPSGRPQQQGLWPKEGAGGISIESSWPPSLRFTMFCSSAAQSKGRHMRGGGKKARALLGGSFSSHSSSGSTTAGALMPALLRP